MQALCLETRPAIPKLCFLQEHVKAVQGYLAAFMFLAWSDVIGDYAAVFKIKIFFAVLLFLRKKHLPLQANFQEKVKYTSIHANNTATSKKRQNNH
jgi:hypothetical protein